MHDDFHRVEIFKGAPNFDSDKQLIPLVGYESGHPRLAFAYSFPKQGATCGWQVYFDKIGDKQDAKHVEWIEYWFSDVNIREFF
jgi:hypothetical protein